MAFQRILIPVELRGDAPALIRYAQKLAATGATLRLLHVVVDETAAFYSDLLDQDKVIQAARARLAALIDDFSSDELKIEGEVRTAFNVHECTTEEIASFAPDVLVMGSHGRRGLDRFLLGSDVLRVLRETTKPICVVKGTRHAQEDGEVSPSLERVAMATDFLPTSTRAHEAFESILRESGADGHLVHVFENEPWLAMGFGVASPDGGYAFPAASTDLEERMQACRAELEKKLQETKAQAEGDGLTMRTELLEGRAWERLPEYCEAHEIDLLLLGSHHYGTLGRLVLGSIAEKTLRSVDCPVLVVSSPEA